jgi:hypothetical protein
VGWLYVFSNPFGIAYRYCEKRQDAVKLFDRLSVDTRDAARAEIHDMDGKPVKIADLRLIAASGQ